MQSIMKLSGAFLAVLAIASCGEPEPKPEKSHPAGATPLTEAETATIQNKADAMEIASASDQAEIVACGLGLLQAEKRGLVASDAQIPPPWERLSTPAEGGRRVACLGSDARGPLTVVVDLKCSDVNDDRCHPLVRVSR